MKKLTLICNIDTLEAILGTRLLTLIEYLYASGICNYFLKELYTLLLLWIFRRVIFEQDQNIY